jgi:hypothetical protein
MIVGDQFAFAIESCITHAYEQLSLRALGFFVIYVGGQRYGVHSSNATMLACSFDEVKNRVARRGGHIAPFANERSAGVIADAFLGSVYAPDQENKRFLDASATELRRLVYSNHLAWAPDGDEAFDDGSYVLQFDANDRVRLIAFKSYEGRYDHDPRTLREIWLEASKFYEILVRWSDAFEGEWLAKPKIANGEKAE